MNLKNDDYIPSYVKIQNYILEHIQEGTYRCGDKIPSENELSQLFSVSRVTANMAIKELSIMGVVQRIKGKGTFIKDTDSIPSASKVLSPNLQLNTSYGTKNHKLVYAKIIPMYPELMEKFGLKEPVLIYEIVRCVNHKNRTTALDFSYIPLESFGTSALQPDEITKNYLHEYLRKCTPSKPSTVKIYVNIPKYPFLDLSLLDFEPMAEPLIWATDICNPSKEIIATTITVSRQGHEKEPFITFSI